MTDLEQLAAVAAVHDWYYEFTEDHSVWKKGNEAQKKIIDSLYRKCNNAGYKEEADRIISLYYPE